LEKNVEAIIETCCGLDVHQANVVACLLTGKANEKPRKQIRSFRTITRDLRAMCEWLRAAGCTHVAMESTGVYWKPVYAVLEGGFELVVGNAHHIRNVPGRKTDVKDSEWLADLMRHGLIRKSFVPPKPMRELRDLLRYRRKLAESGASERNRLLAVLETANIKLANVASDVFGVSGRRMIEALVEGTSSPDQIAQLAKGLLRKKLAELQLALEGSVQPHHRFLLDMQLRRIKNVDDELALLDKYIDEKLEPYRAQHDLLMTIPGVSWLVATVIIAEIGVDMTVFPTVRHLAAWAGVSPGNNESAGKRKGGKARRGNVYLKTILVGAATSAARVKGRVAPSDGSTCL
jgi:transposase